LFFRVDDFNETLLRARALVAGLEAEPHLNPNTGTREFALRDPDGYYVMVNALAAANNSFKPAGPLRGPPLNRSVDMTSAVDGLDDVAITRTGAHGACSSHR
jgi:hypothetical protein